MRFLIVVIFLLNVSLLSGQSSIKLKVDSILNLEYPGGNSPGISVGIVKDGNIIYHGQIGFANLEYDIPFNDNTVFGLASVTKQFTSACIAVLEKKGLLSVNDDVRKYIPELAFYGDTIRIVHLLTHTSGIRNHNILLDLMGFDYEYQGYTNEMIQELMFQQKGVNNKPGEKVLYSNTNYVLLALIVERVSGNKIHKFANSELFEPLGLINTFYKSSLENVVKNRAYSYYKVDGEYKQPKSLNLCVGAGGMASTILDLAKWTNVFLNPESDFSYVASFLSTIDTLNNGVTMKSGRGVFVSPYRGYKTINHSGRDLGMRSQLICIPDLNIGVIVYTNSEHINAVNISYKILDLLISPIYSTEADAEKSYNHNKKELSSISGDYQELNSDLRMRINVENDTLKAQSSFGMAPIAMVPKSYNEFHRIDNPSVTYTFDSTSVNGADLIVDFSGAAFYFERVTLISKPNENLKDFVGKYYSKELNVTYVLAKENNTLILSYPKNDYVILWEGQRDEFGSGRRTKYSFNRDTIDNFVSSFYLAAEGTVKNILFERIK